jgi:hypothetical protein
MRSPVNLTYRGALVDELAHICRHLWTRGRTTGEIAEALYAKDDDVAVLLSWKAEATPLAKAIADVNAIASATLDADLPSGRLELSVGGEDGFQLDMAGNVRSYGQVPVHAFAPAMNLLHALRAHLPGHWSDRRRRASTSVHCRIPLTTDVPVPEVDVIRAIVEPIAIGRAELARDQDDGEPRHYAVANLKVQAADVEMTLETNPPSDRATRTERLAVPDDLRRLLNADDRIRSVSCIAMV